MSSNQLAAAALAGAAAAAAAIFLYAKKARKKRTPVSNPRTFELERFFAQYEFVAQYQLCNSDVSALSLRELLDMCAGDGDMMRA